jgi:hypothetical protein
MSSRDPVGDQQATRTHTLNFCYYKFFEGKNKLTGWGWRVVLVGGVYLRRCFEVRPGDKQSKEEQQLQRLKERKESASIPEWTRRCAYVW